MVSEAHILNFSGDLYERELRIDLMVFIRENKKFDSLESLREQIEKDKEYMIDCINAQ